MATIAINGLGRIGRAAFKIILETPELELRAVNDLPRRELVDALIETEAEDLGLYSPDQA